MLTWNVIDSKHFIKNKCRKLRLKNVAQINRSVYAMYSMASNKKKYSEAEICNYSYFIICLIGFDCYLKLKFTKNNQEEIKELLIFQKSSRTLESVERLELFFCITQRQDCHKCSFFGTYQTLNLVKLWRKTFSPKTKYVKKCFFHCFKQTPKI